MASSVLSSNSDPQRDSSLCSPTISDLQASTAHARNLGSMSMDDLLKNIYADPNLEPFSPAAGAASQPPQGSFCQPKSPSNKTAKEVWKEIVARTEQRHGDGVNVVVDGDDDGAAPEEEMTLEDFLAKAGAVREEEVVRVPARSDLCTYGGDSTFQQQSLRVEAAGFGNGSGNGNGNGIGNGIGHGILNGSGADARVMGGGGRGKRRAVEVPVDKVTQQKQKRMIKNRESAARSRERKQAYTVELESLVTKLEEENARLLNEQLLRVLYMLGRKMAEQTKERFKQLMKNLVPVLERRKPAQVLRRVHSLHW